MCAGPVRTGGGAPTNEAGTTPYCRSTRPGCEYVPGRFAPGAVLLQTSLPTSCCRSTLRVRMRARPVRTGRSGDPAVLLQISRAVGGYLARVQVEVRPNMGVPTKPRSLRMEIGRASGREGREDGVVGER